MNKGVFKLVENGDHFFFTLKAPNFETIGVSETYKTRQAAEGGIESVKLHCIDPANFKRHRAKDKDQSPYFTLRSKNNKVILTSELYSGSQAMEFGIQAVQRYGSIGETQFHQLDPEMKVSFEPTFLDKIAADDSNVTTMKFSEIVELLTDDHKTPAHHPFGFSYTNGAPVHKIKEREKILDCINSTLHKSGPETVFYISNDSNYIRVEPVNITSEEFSKRCADQRGMPLD